MPPTNKTLYYWYSTLSGKNTRSTRGFSPHTATSTTFRGVTVAFLFAIFFLIPSTSFASVITTVYTQPDNSILGTYTTVNTTGLFTGIGGKINKIEFYYNDNGNAVDYNLVAITDITIGNVYNYYNNITSSICGNSFKLTGLNTKTKLTLTGGNYLSGTCTGQPLILDPTHTYGFAVSLNTNNSTIRSTYYGIDTTTSNNIGLLIETIKFQDEIIPTSPYAQDYIRNPINFSGIYSSGITNEYNQIQFSLNNTTQGINLLPITQNITQTITQDNPYNFDINLPFTGNYNYSARLYNTITGSSTTWTAGNSFILGTTTAQIASSTISWTDVTPVKCNSFDIGCYIKTAGVWLLYPSQASVDQFKTINLETTFPFSYAYDTNNVRNELFNTSSTTASATITIPFGTFGNITLLSKGLMESVPFSGLIRTILGWILWIMFADLIYRQILSAHNKNV